MSTPIGGSLWGGTTPGGFWPGASQAQPTVEDVFQSARAQLVGDPNDTSVFTDAILQSYFEIAYRELYQTMAQVQTPRIRRRFYYDLPAYTTQLNPYAIGVFDLEEPEIVEERPIGPPIEISATLPTTPIQVETVTPHGLGLNSEVTVGEVIGTYAPWGRWFVTVLDPNTITLNGSTTDGNAGAGGQLSSSIGYFTPVQALNYNTDRPVMGMLLDYLWEDSVFQFRGCTQQVQIRVTYWANGTPPNNPATILGIASSVSYLATRTAGLAAEAKGFDPLTDRLNMRALGKGMDPNDSRFGGLLRSFLGDQVRGLQRTVHRRLPYGSEGYGNWFPYGIQFGGGNTCSGGGNVTRTGWYNVPVLGGLANVDLTQGDTQYIFLTQDTTVLNYPRPVSESFQFIIDQNSVGGWTLTFGTRYQGLTPTDFSGPTVAGNTRVIIPMTINDHGNAILSGFISGPSPL